MLFSCPSVPVNATGVRVRFILFSRVKGSSVRRKNIDWARIDEGRSIADKGSKVGFAARKGEQSIPARVGRGPQWNILKARNLWLDVSCPAAKSRRIGAERDNAIAQGRGGAGHASQNALGADSRETYKRRNFPLDSTRLDLSNDFQPP